MTSRLWRLNRPQRLCAFGSNSLFQSIFFSRSEQTTLLVEKSTQNICYSFAMLPNRTSQAPQFEAAPNLHSCVLCRKRKVKCDKQRPCYNCIKAHAVCNHSLPAPPRRRKGRERLAEEDLRNRLRRYEELLQSYGAKIDDRNGDDESTRPSDDLFVAPTPEATGQVQPPPQVETLSIQNISHEISLQYVVSSYDSEHD